jgi:DNA-binding NarL/FixJ family response regulator
MGENISCKSIKIFLVDDHTMVRNAVKLFLACFSDISVCGEARNISETLKLIPDLKPDLVITDISLGDGNGIDLIKAIHVLYPYIDIIVLSLHDEQLFVEKAMQAGAKAYVVKSQATEHLSRAIKSVLQGNIYVSGMLLEKGNKQKMLL